MGNGSSQGAFSTALNRVYFFLSGMGSPSQEEKAFLSYVKTLIRKGVLGEEKVLSALSLSLPRLVAMKRDDLALDACRVVLEHKGSEEGSLDRVARVALDIVKEIEWKRPEVAYKIRLIIVENHYVSYNVRDEALRARDEALRDREACRPFSCVKSKPRRSPLI